MEGFMSGISQSPFTNMNNFLIPKAVTTELTFYEKVKHPKTNAPALRIFKTMGESHEQVASFKAFQQKHAEGSYVAIEIGENIVGSNELNELIEQIKNKKAALLDQNNVEVDPSYFNNKVFIPLSKDEFAALTNLILAKFEMMQNQKQETKTSLKDHEFVILKQDNVSQKTIDKVRTSNKESKSTKNETSGHTFTEGRKSQDAESVFQAQRIKAIREQFFQDRAKRDDNLKSDLKKVQIEESRDNSPKQG